MILRSRGCVKGKCFVSRISLIFRPGRPALFPETLARRKTAIRAGGPAAEVPKTTPFRPMTVHLNERERIGDMAVLAMGPLCCTLSTSKSRVIDDLNWLELRPRVLSRREFNFLFCRFSCEGGIDGFYCGIPKSRRHSEHQNIHVSSRRAVEYFHTESLRRD